MTEYFSLATFSTKYRGYYLDADLNLYSDKSGQISKITPIRSQLNCYKVNVPKLIRDIQQTEAWEEFLSNAKKMVVDSWKDFISNAKKAVDDKTNDDLNDELNAVNLPMKTDLRQNVYIISSVDDQGRPVFSDNPRIHGTEESVVQEVTRLIQKNPNRRFAYFKCCGVAQRYLSVTWM